jgi:hypothetical protein
MRVQYNDRTYIDLDHQSHERTRPFHVEGARNVIIDTVKRGEDDDFASADAPKTVIVRLYEAFGGQFSYPLSSVFSVGRGSLIPACVWFLLLLLGHATADLITFVTYSAFLFMVVCIMG